MSTPCVAGFQDTIHNNQSGNPKCATKASELGLRWQRFESCVNKLNPLVERTRGIRKDCADMILEYGMTTEPYSDQPIVLLMTIDVRGSWLHWFGR